MAAGTPNNKKFERHVVTIDVTDIPDAEVHVIDKHNGRHRIPLSALDACQAIPAKNEHWVVSRLDYNWTFEKRFDDGTEVVALGDMAEGDTRVRATNVLHFIGTRFEFNAVPFDPQGGVTQSYVEYTAPVTISATTEAGGNTIVTSDAIAADGTSSYWVEFYTPKAATTDQIIFTLWDGSTVVGTIAAVIGTTTIPVMVKRKVTPTVANHTYSVTAWRNTVNGTVNAGTGGSGTALLPGFINIYKAS